MKRGNGKFRALVEAGAACVGSECLEAGRKRRPTYKLHGRDMNASRAVWWLAHGDPGDLNVLHRCGNDQCLNVLHLYLGTIADNARDTVLMDRHPKRSLTWAEAQEIARLYRPGKAGDGNGNTAALAAKYQVSYDSIRRAARRVNRFNRKEAV